jgi:hypothetical protein
MAPYYGPPLWTPTMDPHYTSKQWTPTMDPHNGPPLWTPTIDPTMDPHYGLPLWTSTMDPHYRPPIWTPILDLFVCLFVTMRPAGTRCICELYWHSITKVSIIIPSTRSTYIMDRQNGPPIWTTNMDFHYGPPL